MISLQINGIIKRYLCIFLNPYRLISLYKAWTPHQQMLIHFYIMKLAIILLSLAAFGSADLLNNILSYNTAYGYLTKYGIPEAERIQKAEEEYLRNKPIISRITGGSPAASGQFKYQVNMSVYY